jgi:hypothetical protein
MMAHGFSSWSVGNSVHSDVVLVSADGKMLYAHKYILAAHSPVK